MEIGFLISLSDSNDQKRKRPSQNPSNLVIESMDQTLYIWLKNIINLYPTYVTLTWYRSILLNLALTISCNILYAKKYTYQATGLTIYLLVE